MHTHHNNTPWRWKPASLETAQRDLLWAMFVRPVDVSLYFYLCRTFMTRREAFDCVEINKIMLWYHLNLSCPKIALHFKIDCTFVPERNSAESACVVNGLCITSRRYWYSFIVFINYSFTVSNLHLFTLWPLGCNGISYKYIINLVKLLIYLLSNVEQHYDWFGVKLSPTWCIFIFCWLYL